MLLSVINQKLKKINKIIKSLVSKIKNGTTMTKFTQGFFKPKNPKKYKGDPTNIVYRSSYELKYMMQLDHDPNVISWGSEEKIIYYISPVDGKPHRYFVDFHVTKRVGNQLKTELIEIKPFHQTVEPKKGKKKDRTFFNEVCTYGINQAKWKAARKFCEENGYEFKILTEYELGLAKKKD